MVATKEREHLKPWGNFNPEQIKLLKAAGYNINFFIAPTRLYNDEWEEMYDLLVVKRESSQIYFIAISREDNMGELLNLEEEKMPDASLTDLDGLIKSIEQKLRKQDEAMEILSEDLLSVEVAITALENEIQFSRVLRSEEHTSELQSRPHLVC